LNTGIIKEVIIMRKDSIDIMGARENLEKVKDFAWNIGKFGSTWLDGKWLYVAIAADTDKMTVDEYKLSLATVTTSRIDGRVQRRQLKARKPLPNQHT